MLIQVRKLKQENKYLQEKLDCKRSSVDKEMMTNAIEKSSKVQIQTFENGSNAKLVKVQKNNLIVTSLQESTENGSEKQIQKSLEAPKVDVLVNTLQEIRVPYCDPNHKSHYDRRKNQKGNYQYYSYKEQRQNRQLLTIDLQAIPLKVDLIWTTSYMTQHFHTILQERIILFRQVLQLPTHNVMINCYEQEQGIKSSIIML